MTEPSRPSRKPERPYFSSGPCPKPPGWSPSWLDGALLGRSHRSPVGRARLQEAIQETRNVLRVPADYRIAIVPGSDTGAMELAMWSLLGARGVDVFVFDVFGAAWARDIDEQLKLDDVRCFTAPYGELPDLCAASATRDIVVTANGTTSGVRIPDYNWIGGDREGLVFVDATSALFAQPIDWLKTDVVTYSWQKVLGGEAGHGMLVLSPRAVERAQGYCPRWPVPKLFRLTQDGTFNQRLFEGETLNTPSMLCVEDYLAAVRWVASLGGVEAACRRADANAKVLWDWLGESNWAENVAPAGAQEIWSNTSVCFRIKDAVMGKLDAERRFHFCRQMALRLEEEDVAYDIVAHRHAPPGFRVWCGATVERQDVLDLTLWLDWAFAKTRCEWSV